jgi:multimeric flavodoxin WrbA
MPVKPGVEKDMGDRDAWPGIREKMLAADIFVLGTPTWMGHMSSVAQRVLERLDAELSGDRRRGQARDLRQGRPDCRRRQRGRRPRDHR